MKDHKSEALSGKHNERLNRIDTRNSEITFPLADSKEINKATGVSIPAIEDVVHAKEWVDDGSKL